MCRTDVSWSNSKKPHIVSATPERATALIAQGKLKMHEVTCIVVDEADLLLVSPIGETVMAVIHAAPSRRQLVFVSATRGQNTSEYIRQLAPDVHNADTGSDRISSTIEHQFVIVEQRKKSEMVRRMVHAVQPERALVFVHRKVRAE